MSEWMLFCLGNEQAPFSGEGYQKNYRIFNKSVTKVAFSNAIKSRPSLSLPPAFSYEEAWKEVGLSEEFKKWVKKLPNFDPILFESITGLAI